MKATKSKNLNEEGPLASAASPRALVVEEEHQVEPLVGLLLPLLPQAQDVSGRDGDGHPVVQQTLLGHLRVDDLEGEAAGRRSWRGTRITTCTLTTDTA